MHTVVPLVSKLMATFETRVRVRSASRWLLFALEVAAVCGASYGLLASGRHHDLVMPPTGVVTLTGYGTSPRDNFTIQPRSVVLTGSQATVLRSRISEIPVLTSSVAPVICMEQQTVFKIVVGTSRSSKSLWTALAERCPAPGVLGVHGEGVGAPEAGRYCSLKDTVLSFFPRGVVNVTREEMRSC
jgi:hypothetical protein